MPSTLEEGRNQEGKKIVSKKKKKMMMRRREREREKGIYVFRSTQK